MTTSTIDGTECPPRRRGRSAFAIVAGILAATLPALALDQVFHALAVYPPWGEPMVDTGDNLVALAYRMVFAVAGGYVAAWLAPADPMRHVTALGIVGTILAVLGLTAMSGMGPVWYPAALVVMALPLTLLGGWLQTRRAAT